MPKIEISKIMTPKQAAEYLGITTMTLWRWSRDGKIKPIMLDHQFFNRDDLDKIKRNVKSPVIKTPGN